MRSCVIVCDSPTYQTNVCLKHFSANGQSSPLAIGSSVLRPGDSRRVAWSLRVVFFQTIQGTGLPTVPGGDPQDCLPSFVFTACIAARNFILNATPCDGLPCWQRSLQLCLCVRSSLPLSSRSRRQPRQRQRRPSSSRLAQIRLRSQAPTAPSSSSTHNRNHCFLSRCPTSFVSIPR